MKKGRGPSLSLSRFFPLSLLLLIFPLSSTPTPHQNRTSPPARARATPPPTARPRPPTSRPRSRSPRRPRSPRSPRPRSPRRPSSTLVSFFSSFFFLPVDRGELFFRRKELCTLTRSLYLFPPPLYPKTNIKQPRRLARPVLLPARPARPPSTETKLRVPAFLGEKNTQLPTSF